MMSFWEGRIPRAFRRGRAARCWVVVFKSLAGVMRPKMGSALGVSKVDQNIHSHRPSYLGIP